MSEKTYLSRERYIELEKELERLKGEGRKEVAEWLKSSKALGDLSENSEYHEAKKEQELLELKIAQTENILRTAEIIKKPKRKGVVSIGSKVRIKKNGKKMEYTIVGSTEANPAVGFISNESPVGKMLLGKQVGEKFSIKTSDGEVKYEVLSVD